MKVSKIVAIVIWSLVAILLTVFLVFAVNGNWDIGSFSFNRSIKYANAENYSVGSFESDEKIDSVEINWQSGKVTVVAYDGKTLKCTESESENDNRKMRWLIEDGKLTVQFSKPNLWLGIGSNGKKELAVYIPRDFLPLTEVRVNNVSSDVSADSIECADLVIDNVSGELSVSNAECDMLCVDTVSGDVDAAGSVATLEFETVSGNLKLNDGIMPSRVDFDSVSGNAILCMPEGDGFAAKFDSVSGGFECDFPTVKNDGKYVFGDGSGIYSFESVSGNITVKKAG